MAYAELNALVVDPNSGCRVRLKNAMLSVVDFKRVRTFDNFQRLLELLQNPDDKYDVIFIAERFGESAIEKFIKAAGETKTGATCAYVLSLEPNSHVAKTVANSLRAGFDAVLFEPYSAETVSEVVPVARQVQKDRVNVQKKASMSFLIKDCLHSVTKVANSLKYGNDSINVDLKQFHKITHEIGLLPESAWNEYFETLISESVSEPPPKSSGIVRKVESSSKIREKIQTLDFEKVEKKAPEVVEEKKSVLSNRSSNYGAFIIRKR